MFGSIATRLLAALLICAGLVGSLLALSRYSAVTPGRIALGPNATSAAVSAYNDKVGFNDPLPERFVSYVHGLFTGNLGVSARTQTDVATDLSTRWPATLELAVAGLVLALLLGLMMGLASARPWKGSFGIRLTMTILGSAPVFLVAFVAMIVFGSKLGVLPLTGRSSVAGAPTGPTGLLTVDSLLAGDPGALWDAIQHLIMPALCISLLPAVAIGRILRSGLQDGMQARYAMTAYSKGLGSSTVLVRHVLRNAAGPALSIAGLQFGLMLAGVVIVEQIFGWPGMGAYVAEAIPASDFPVIMAVTCILGIVYVAINALVDVLQLWADPTIRK